MFDNPLADQVPGKIVRIGFPWHGLVKAPALTGSTSSCPLADVLLETHSGKTLLPFQNSDRFISAPSVLALYGAFVFRDPRGVDVAESEDGQDWSQYMIVSSWQSLGEAEQLRGSEFAYSAGGRVHVVQVAATTAFLYQQIRVGRNLPAQWRDEGVEIPITGSTVFSSVIRDVSPGGDSVLMGSLAQVDISGQWPDFAAARTELLTPEQRYTDVAQASGDLIADAVIMSLNVTANCPVDGVNSDDSYQCGYVFYPEPISDGASGGSIYQESYDETVTRLRRWFVTAYFDSGAAQQVWFVSDYTDNQRHDPEWAYQEIGLEAGPDYWEEVGVNIAWQLGWEDARTTQFSVRLETPAGVVSEVVTQRLQTGSTLRESTFKDGGLYGVAKGEVVGTYNETIESNQTVSIVFDGVDILAEFPEVNPNTWDFSTSQPDARIEVINLRDSGRELDCAVSVMEYSTQLVALKVVCTYRELISGTYRVLRRRIYIGNAFARGEVDSEKYASDDPDIRLYGEACPKTKKIARNYTYPICWI